MSNETPQWLCIVRPNRSTFLQDITDEERATVGEHFRYLQKLCAEGILILAGRTQTDQPFGITIFTADSREQAERIVAEDPAVKKGVFLPELYPYAVAVSRAELRS